MRLNRFMIRPLVEQGLREELNAGDTTGGFLVWDEDPVQSGQIYAKGHGIVCGLLFADETIRLIDPDAQIEHCVNDGDEIAPGTVLLRIKARASAFFMIERAALDWVQQLSAIATKTRRYLDLVRHTKVRLTDTRKGWPGLRMVQKYAVRVGGAHNHIFNLSNCVLVKDNHIKIAGSIRNAVEILRARARSTPSRSRSSARPSRWCRRHWTVASTSSCSTTWISRRCVRVSRWWPVAPLPKPPVA